MADEEKQPAEKAPARRPAAAVAGMGAGGHPVVVAPAPPPATVLPKVSRRGVIIGSFWAAIGGTLALIGGSLVWFLWPRGVQKLSGQHVLEVNANDLAPGSKQDVVVLIPNPRAPLESLDAKIFLVRFDAEQARLNGGEEGAILALYRKCPHLGCTVPYNSTYTFADPDNGGQSVTGWFLCPCHGSTYSDAGRRVFGPAPRSMDVYPLEIAEDGTMTVNLDNAITGTPENATHATPFPV
jgi:cytochrome b6-f complex iron-sulfur subunit